ncbi:vascular-related unknown protein 1-like [Magnolia sinica]|uniref:vascular-related unknown protein 1-like n=1 Tax=Magnolia sinica TaxID=86752 RepID=UPI002657C6FA|nr:vascular-related unknown protein 1-like [Magnolia sinica]
MEDSIQSSMKKEVPSSQKSLCSEESGWTMYFDDFLPADNRNSSASSFGYMGSSSSLVSDAASCAEAAGKLSGHITLPSGPTQKSCRELSLKKRRKRGALEDESLEDTASSPVNSPKVSDLKQLDMSPRKIEDDKNSFQEKEIASDGCLELQTDERNEMDFVGKESTELKKRGLCLVPLSVLLNYLG